MSSALVIDYTPEIVALVRTVLRTRIGIDRIDTASSGDAAAKLIEATDHDVVILEPVVPYGDERLLTWLVRTRPSVCPRTILITPAPVERELRVEIASARVHALLDKPFDVDMLADVVRRCIGEPHRPRLAPRGLNALAM